VYFSTWAPCSASEVVSPQPLHTKVPHQSSYQKTVGPAIGGTTRCKPRFLELPDKSSTCSVASLAQMAARSALAHGGQRLMRNAALETADLQHRKGLFHHQGHETTANTRQTTVAFDTLDGPYQALYRRHKPTLTR
jgi:hypothetical protein